MPGSIQLHFDQLQWLKRLCCQHLPWSWWILRSHINSTASGHGTRSFGSMASLHDLTSTLPSACYENLVKFRSHCSTSIPEVRELRPRDLSNESEHVFSGQNIETDETLRLLKLHETALIKIAHLKNPGQHAVLGWVASSREMGICGQVPFQCLPSIFKQHVLFSSTTCCATQNNKSLSKHAEHMYSINIGLRSKTRCLHMLFIQGWFDYFRLHNQPFCPGRRVGESRLRTGRLLDPNSLQESS